MISFDRAKEITQGWLDAHRDPSAPGYVLDDQSDALQDDQFWMVAHDSEIAIDGFPVPLVSKVTGDVIELPLPSGFERLDRMWPVSGPCSI